MKKFILKGNFSDTYLSFQTTLSQRAWTQVAAPTGREGPFEAHGGDRPTGG